MGAAVPVVVVVVVVMAMVVVAVVVVMVVIMMAAMVVVVVFMLAVMAIMVAVEVVVGSTVAAVVVRGAVVVIPCQGFCCLPALFQQQQSSGLHWHQRLRQNLIHMPCCLHRPHKVSLKLQPQWGLPHPSRPSRPCCNLLHLTYPTFCCTSHRHHYHHHQPPHHSVAKHLRASSMFRTRQRSALPEV